ncbi:glycosyltransferase [Metabacillus sp. KIGAM252]|uniref:Glycosyltransferase n=1 Tax=Metabacillus flavus TaxID=2823519 RepID=A0ABS5LH02_9BACI|nr:glycosyltransferase [Metabacillus flavus]MBS2969649.1 glycosyltransferase [Metabacillus flavus]
MKKNLLFVMNNLNCGGAEKALISLLETIDYSRFEVDLLLFKKEGLFLSKVPSQVNLLNEINEFTFFDMPIKEAINKSIKQQRFDITFSRIRAGIIYKTEKNGAKCEQKAWNQIRWILKPLKKNYDVAIGYLEKNPIYYCVDKVKAHYKIGFIHNDYNKLGMIPKMDQQYFRQLDSLVTVSEECANILIEVFPDLKEKIEVMYNIISPEVIRQLSLDESLEATSKIKLVSVGRLNYQKGFEMAIDACKLLVEKGYEVVWDILGEGEEREKLETLVQETNLNGIVNFLGIKENPYPFIKNADIYVQPSRFEGKSIAIDEAKILHKPIVVTNFSTAKDQIKNNHNGLIVGMDSTSLANGIEKLILDPALRDQLSDNLSKEKLGTTEEIIKFYRFIHAI